MELVVYSAEDVVKISSWVACLVTILWIIIHRLKRIFQERCKVCGSFRMEHLFYMCPDSEALHNSVTGVYYIIYKFSKCKSCTALHPEARDRCVSKWAIWWKQNFRSEDFVPKDSLMREAGFSDIRKSVTILPMPKQSLKPIQGLMVFPQGGKMSNGHKKGKIFGR